MVNSEWQRAQHCRKSGDPELHASSSKPAEVSCIIMRRVLCPRDSSSKIRISHGFSFWDWWMFLLAESQSSRGWQTKHTYPTVCLISLSIYLSLLPLPLPFSSLQPPDSITNSPESWAHPILSLCKDVTSKHNWVVSSLSVPLIYVVQDWEDQHSDQNNGLS